MSEMFSGSQNIDISVCELCPFSTVRMSHSYYVPISGPLTGFGTYSWIIEFVCDQKLKDFAKQRCIIGSKYASTLKCSSSEILLPQYTTAWYYLSLYPSYCTVSCKIFMISIPLCTMLWILPNLGILPWYDYHLVGMLPYYEYHRGVNYRVNASTLRILLWCEYNHYGINISRHKYSVIVKVLLLLSVSRISIICLSLFNTGQ